MSDRDSERERERGREDSGGSASRVSGRSILAGIGVAGLLGAAGTASADPQGQVGRSGDPLTALYTNELNGGVTGNTSLTGLTGDGLTIDAGALSAAPARPDVDDGSTSVADAAGLTFASGFTLADDGDGTVTVGLDTRYRQGWKLLPSDDDDRDGFGQSVALSDGGSTALVGAYKDELSDGDNEQEGSAYVFADDSTNWREVVKLTPGGNSDNFGYSVALSDDGTTALIGARLDELSDGDGDSEGAAYVFVDDGSGWSQVTKLFASDGGDFDSFGESVALSGDGTTALVGASGNDNSNGSNAGAAYVFDGSGGWSGVTTETTKLTASDGGDSDSFGKSVALSDDGTTAIVGASGDDNSNGSDAGAAYVFDGSGGWASVTTETTKLVASDGDGDDQFGYSAALSDDGTTALVGARFDENPNSTDAGSAYVFADDGSGWSQVTKLAAGDGDSDDRFGWSVALSDGGTTALVGAPADENPNGSSAGSAYVFADDGSWSQVTKLVAGDGDSGDNFGESVVLSDDGTTVLIGARRDEDPNGLGAGSVYFYYEAL